METIQIKYKSKNGFFKRFKRTSKVNIEIYTEAEEIPYERYFLALKLASISSDSGANPYNMKTALESAIKLIDSNNVDSAKNHINRAINSLNFVWNEIRLDLASFFPFVKSINGKDLDRQLTIEKCILLANNYSNILPLSILKKKAKS